MPVADMDGNVEQGVFFRVTKIAVNGTVLDARYFATCKCSRSLCVFFKREASEPAAQTVSPARWARV